jgi:hypothetical protein
MIGLLALTEATKRVGVSVPVGRCRELPLSELIGMYDNLPQAYQGLAEEWGDRAGTVELLGIETRPRKRLRR